MKNIKFNTPMLALVLGGAKTQTRRPIKFNLTGSEYFTGRIIDMDVEPYMPSESGAEVVRNLYSDNLNKYFVPCPYNEGDTVQVNDSSFRLHISNIRVEHLHDISTQDAVAEGFDASNPVFRKGISSVEGFLLYWNELYGTTEYEAANNPVVWIYSFHVLKIGGAK